MAQCAETRGTSVDKTAHAKPRKPPTKVKGETIDRGEPSTRANESAAAKKYQPAPPLFSINGIASIAWGNPSARGYRYGGWRLNGEMIYAARQWPLPILKYVPILPTNLSGANARIHWVRDTCTRGRSPHVYTIEFPQNGPRARGLPWFGLCVAFWLWPFRLRGGFVCPFRLGRPAKRWCRLSLMFGHVRRFRFICSLVRLLASVGPRQKLGAYRNKPAVFK